MSSFSNNNAKLDHLNERLHRASGIRNKAKKLEVMAKIQREKKLLSEDNRKKRKREREELGDKAPPKQVPKTIDSMRKFDETTVEENDEEIMAEIYARGPVSAYINANCLEHPTYTGGIIMYDTCAGSLTNHAISLVSYSSENGTDYWVARNSWGSYWGEDGKS